MLSEKNRILKEAFLRLCSLKTLGEIEPTVVHSLVIRPNMNTLFKKRIQNLLTFTPYAHKGVDDLFSDYKRHLNLPFLRIPEDLLDEHLSSENLQVNTDSVRLKECDFVGKYAYVLKSNVPHLQGTARLVGHFGFESDQDYGFIVNAVDTLLDELFPSSKRNRKTEEALLDIFYNERLSYKFDVELDFLIPVTNYTKLKQDYAYYKSQTGFYGLK